jgi:hypothetical protein
MSFLTNIVCAALAFGTGMSVCAQESAPTKPSEQLKIAVRKILNDPRDSSPDMITRITVATVKTGDGNAEYLVYVSGQAWCGSGGCTLLVLEPTGSTFKVLGNMDIVQLPIRILPSMKDGHPDIGVVVRGGGVGTAYEAVLSFDGKNYPENPSIRPARKLAGSEGKIVIANTNSSVALYDQ